MRLAAILIATIVAFGAVAAVPSAAVGESDSCAVLFDFGNGKVLWADIEVEEGMSAFDLTSAATEELGIDFNYSESAYGIFVNGFDGVIGAWPFEWWHLWTWNASEGIWEMSWTGAGDLSTEGLEAIAWSYVMDRPDYSAQTPLATPDHRYPWGSFRHDLSSSGNSPIDSPVRAEVAWELNLSNGQIPTSIVTARGLVYVMTSGVFNWTSFVYDSSPKLVCVDLEGAAIWEAEIGGAGYQIASPLVTSDIVTIPSTDGKLYAFDSADGTPLWEVETGFSWTGITSSPISYRNQIIVGGGDGKVYSYGENGSLLWAVQIASSIYFSSPSASNGVVYIGSEDGKLHAVAADGSGEIWNATLDGKVRSAPLLLDDLIVVTYSTYEGFVPVDGGVVALSYDGSELWRVDVNSTSSSPALCSEGIVVTSEDGLTLVSAEGDVIWKREVGAPIKGSPSVGDEVIYAVTYEPLSELYAVDIEGSVLWHFPLEPEQYSMSSPAISDGMLLVASDNSHVYAFVEEEIAEGGEGLTWAIAGFLIAIGVVGAAAVLTMRKGSKGGGDEEKGHH